MRTIKKGFVHRKNDINDINKVFLLNDLHFKAGTDSNPNASGAIGGGGEDMRYFYASPNNIRDFVKIANIEKPDLILLLGDMCDNPSDWLLFNQIWSELDSEIKTFITLGNHDFDNKSYTDLVSILSMTNEQTVAGSKFNRTFELGDNLFVVIDTTFNSENEHGSHYVNVRMHDESVEWLKNIIINSTQKNIFICTHVGIQLKNIQYFENQQAELIQSIIETNKKTFQEITWLYGHHHVVDTLKQTNTGTENVGYLLPANILWEQGRFTEVVVKQNNFNLNTRILKY